MSQSSPPTIDPSAARRWQRIAQPRSAWLHEEVARRMQERLDWIVRQPRSWMHWEPVRGGLEAHASLLKRYPKSEVRLHASHPDELRLAQRSGAGAWWSPGRWFRRDEAPSSGSPVDMVWANMSLHMAEEPLAVIKRWHESLTVDGFLMFSCLGPDTLVELRGLYQAMGWPVPSHAFTDMHDLGDMLVAQGFAEPVMDMERIELTFQSPERLLTELRELGRNLHRERFPGLRGRAWRDRLHQALNQLADPQSQGALKLTFEVIYGHAYKPQRRLAVEPETRLTVDEMRQSLRKAAGRP